MKDPLQNSRKFAGSYAPGWDGARLRAYYEFPENLRGAGERVGVVLLGGGFHWDDLELFFSERELRLPTIDLRFVCGAVNAPASPQAIRRGAIIAGIGDVTPEEIGGPVDARERVDLGVLWTFEATLSVELLGSLLPKAEILVCFAPATLTGKVKALQALLDEDPPPGAVSCCWGGYERLFAERDIAALETLFRQAVEQRVTVCFSSGDFGDGTSRFGASWETAEVFYPASSPHVLACGGTSLLNRDRPQEIPWFEPLRSGRTVASGGGFSRLFEQPPWQETVAAPEEARGRGVPDVSAKADIWQGYELRIGGIRATIGGTSAAAPFWAAVVALVNQVRRRNGLARIGHIGPRLYREEVRRTLRDIQSGAIGIHQAGPGWDPCTGLGSPRVGRLVEVLSRD